MRKIGILGGTFDPPHMGHLIIANEVLHILELDEILFIPTKIPPHKRNTATDATHRVNMLQLATKQNPKFTVNTDEVEREGISYSIDTVERLLEKLPESELFFIIGADMVEYLPKWYKIDELIDLLQFVGVNRLHHSVKSMYPIIEVNIPLIEISSSMIRERLNKHKSVAYFLPEDVLAYIKEQNLYGFS